jgi:hypothetical protein
LAFLFKSTTLKLISPTKCMLAKLMNAFSFYKYLAKKHRYTGDSITTRLVNLFYCGGLGGEESRLTFGAGVLDRLCAFVKEKTDFTCSG